MQISEHNAKRHVTLMITIDLLEISSEGATNLTALMSPPSTRLVRRMIPSYQSDAAGDQPADDLQTYMTPSH
jgi:hypothetical protein